VKTNSLRINQISESAYERYLQYLQALDSLDIEAYANFLADDCEVQSNNSPPMKGKEAITQGLGAYWRSFKALEHELLNIYGTDQNYVLEAINHYTRLDEKKVSIRAVAFTDLNEAGLVKSVRFYTDTTPVFA
jgi:hypothetical protein